MSRLGFHTVTLGCKLNRFDTAAIEGELARRGLAPEPDAARAAVVVVNTCTVTHRADAEARRLIRSVRRRNPGCRLLVTGCYAEREAEALAALAGVDVVFGNRDKPRLGEILDRLGLPPAPDGPTPAGDRGCDEAATLPPALHFGERARAFLKIQEGCRLACSYCVIPQVRGPSRSVPAPAIERALAALLATGRREVVLTGVNTGDWGRDLVPRSDLAALLRRLLDACGPNRIRLNSLEPRTVTPEIVELMASEPRLAPHLQVPLQSGSDAVLAAMRRNYRATDWLARVGRLRARVPDAAIGADVIVGFPGETAARFDETVAFLRSAPLDYLHVFSWSARPGTPAAGLDGRVDPAEIRERSRVLRTWAASAGLRFRRRFVGRVLDAVVLGAGAGGHVRALTGNFIEVELPAGSAERGDLVGAHVLDATAERTAATRERAPAWARPA